MFYETKVLEAYGKLKKLFQQRSYSLDTGKFSNLSRKMGVCLRKMSLRTKRPRIPKKHPLEMWVRMIIKSEIIVFNIS
jgi:hypothetical protein